MRLRKIRLFSGIFCLIIIGILVDTVFTTPVFMLEEEAKKRLLNISFPIELTFVSGKLWQYRIVKGELLLQKVVVGGPGWKENRPYVYFPDEAPNGLPHVSGCEYHGPYRLSPDKSLMILSISSPTKGGSPAKDFVIVNVVHNQILFQRSSLIRYFVDDIAWSPNSSMFAVLDISSRLYLGISGILRIFIGHPAVVCKLYLSVYDREGNLLVRSKVATGLIDGGGQVSWEEKIGQKTEGSGLNNQQE
jgi:hypothetical protein